MLISPTHPLLRRLVTLRQGELAAMLWSFAYFFCLLCSYYVLRPVRDELGIQGGGEHLPAVLLYRGGWTICRGYSPQLFSRCLPRFRYLAGHRRGFPAENCYQSSTCFAPPTCWCSTASWSQTLRPRASRRRFLCGSACSICLSCRFSGVSWQICSATNRRAGCMDSFRRAEAWAL